MIFGNYNNLTLLIFIIILFIGLFFFWYLFSKNNNKNIFLLIISFVFLIINIFELRGGYSSNIDNIKGGKIVFVLDVSKSMTVQDIVYKQNYLSRMEAIKGLIDNYITLNTNNLYGLIVFAGEALEVLPFTYDLSIAKTILHGLNSNNISINGTNINSVFYSLENYFSGDINPGLVVIFTDGGDDDISISADLIKGLKKKGIKVLIVGVGTENGKKIPIGKDFFGNNIFKKYKDEYIISKLNLDVLKKISKKYNIDYITIDNVDDFKKINHYITDNVNLISLEKNIHNRFDYTRLLITISFVFFILYLTTDFIIGRRY